MHHQNQLSTLSISFLACEAALLAAALCLIVLFPELPKNRTRSPAKAQSCHCYKGANCSEKQHFRGPFAPLLLSVLHLGQWPNHILTQLPRALLYMLISIYIHVTSQSHGLEEVRGALTNGPGCCTAY